MSRAAPLLIALGLLIAAAPPQSAGQGIAPKPTATIDVLDVGQGDSILIRSPEGKAALVDAGPSNRVVKLLKDRGVTSLDLVVVSHHHQDHYGGMAEVIKAFHPRVFLATDSGHTTPHYLALLELIRDSGIKVIFPTDVARRIELGSVLLTVLPQPPEDRADENDNSIGIRLQFGLFSMLLTGDSEGPERAFWGANVPGLVNDATVLKVAHHGSRNGTDARWLEAVRPKLAIASLGATNDYGHPHPETLALLSRSGIPLRRTDRDGTVEVATDGIKWGVVGSGGTPRAPPKEDRGVKVADSRRPAGGPVDLNSATREELIALPGIGPVLADRIIEGRPYRTVDGLKAIKGIGPKKLEELRPLVRAR